MSSFLDTVESQFGSKNLYIVLGVEKSASENELRRAYHRLSLKVHPDRAEPEEVDQATQKFQVLGKIYSILCDKDKRLIYDEEGVVDEEDDALFRQDRDWMEYWRLLFQKVTIGDIEKFEETYKGSEEERDTLKSVYLEKEGDMNAILEEVLCASLDDEPRFREIISKWIAEKEVPSFPAFVKESESKRMLRKRKFEGEAKEAEEALKKIATDANGGESSLTAMIKARQKTRSEHLGDFFNALEEKYCHKDKEEEEEEEDNSLAPAPKRKKNRASKSAAKGAGTSSSSKGKGGRRKKKK